MVSSGTADSAESAESRAAHRLELGLNFILDWVELPVTTEPGLIGFCATGLGNGGVNGAAIEPI